VSRILKALAKIGLIELGEDERPLLKEAPHSDARSIDRLLQEEAHSPSAVLAKTPQADQEAGQKGDTGITEGLSLEEIYALAQVAPSPYPAEKLLKVLDGLRAMDAATRKAAILAMDAADEGWSVEDTVLDAQRKIQALQEASAKLVDVVAQAEAKALGDLQAQEHYQQEATASIRKQIADLEELLQQELQKVAEEKATIQARVQQAREACARETARFEQEITRLQEIPQGFAPPLDNQAKRGEDGDDKRPGRS
jgi:hypothetical protein